MVERNETPDAMREEIIQLKNEVDVTIRTLYSLQRFNESLKTEVGISHLNKNANFWRIFHYSIVTNLLIGTRRIFDNGSDVKTISKFIKRFKGDFKLFSREAYEARIMSNLIVRPSWLDSSLVSHTALTQRDFGRFNELINANCKLLQVSDEYYVISNEIIGHAIHINNPEYVKGELSKIQLPVIEKALLTLLFIIDKIYVNYTTGHILHEGQELFGYPYKTEIYDAIDKQLTGS